MPSDFIKIIIQEYKDNHLVEETSLPKIDSSQYPLRSVYLCLLLELRDILNKHIKNTFYSTSKISSFGKSEMNLTEPPTEPFYKLHSL